MFWKLPIAATAISAFGFLLFAGPMTLLAAKDPAWAQKYRIQLRREVASKNTEMVLGSLKCFTINNLLMLVLVLVAWPLLKLSKIHDGPAPAAFELGWQLLFFVYLDDFLFYWAHRALHQGPLFRYIHSWHHKITTPWAITGHYMHPLEYLITGSLVLIGPLLVGCHVYTLWIWVLFRQWEAAEGHAGYYIPWSITRWMPGGHAALHHDYHHAKVKGNYAGFFAIWDRVFGTYSVGYEEFYEKQHQR